jgi:release factor glutamine methyltransferase
VEGLRILDLGTGTGAVVISLLSSLARARATAVDISPHALAVAHNNALRHRVADRLSLHEGSWCEGLHGTFDLVVGNPPYLTANSIGGLEPAVADHDPRISLDGGSDGLDAYRQIGQAVVDFLSRRSLVLLEIGWAQRDSVIELMCCSGLRQPHDFPAMRLDLRGIARVVCFERQER